MIGTFITRSSRNWVLVSLAAWLPTWAAGCSSSNDDPAAPTSAAGNSAGGNSSGAGASAGGTSGGGNGTAGNASGGTGSSELSYAPCAADEIAGGFRIQLATEYTGVNGSVRNGTVPSDVPEVVSEDGACRLLAQRVLFCDPTCGASETCADDGNCIPYPTNQQVGIVTVTGLNGELTMEPGATGSYTNPAMPALPHPGFDEGAAIVLTAEGGDLETFTLHGEGVAALSVSEDPLVATMGEPLPLTWEAGATSDAVHVSLKIEFNRHGGTPSWVECDMEDTGSFEVPASIIDALLGLEVSGWPTVTLTRRSVDSVDLSVGCVELQVFSQVVRELEVAGIQSCDDDHPCPDEQECPVNLICPE